MFVKSIFFKKPSFVQLYDFTQQKAVAKLNDWTKELLTI